MYLTPEAISVINTIIAENIERLCRATFGYCPIDKTCIAKVIEGMLLGYSISIVNDAKTNRTIIVADNKTICIVETTYYDEVEKIINVLKTTKPEIEKTLNAIIDELYKLINKLIYELYFVVGESYD